MELIQLISTLPLMMYSMVFIVIIATNVFAKARMHLSSICIHATKSFKMANNWYDCWLFGCRWLSV